MSQLRWIGFVALHSSIAYHMSFVPEILGFFHRGLQNMSASSPRLL